MEIQKNIKNNVDDLRCIMNEMSSWEKEMKRKESSLFENGSANSFDDLPPIRSKFRKEEDCSNEKIIESENLSISENCSNREKSLVEKDIGNEFVKEKKWTDAIHHYTSAIDYFTKDPVFFCNRAQCYLQTKQWKEAIADCNQALELDPNYVKAFYRKGLALKEMNEFKEARQNLLKAIDLEPNNQNVKNDLLSLNDLLSDTISSEQANKLNGNLTEVQKREKSLDEKQRGNAFVAQNKWTDAIHHYTEAMKWFSEDPTFYCNRALCFLSIEKFKEAETDCTIALQLDPEYIKAYHRRGLALKKLGQLKEAKEDFIKALELDPKNACILKDLSKLEKRLNDCNSFELSLETKFENTKFNDKDLAYLKKDKGNLFVQKKDWKSAIECYTEACKLYPDDISFNLNRALCFLKIKEFKKALLDCTLVLERDPKNLKAYFRRAEAHQNLENLTKAHDDLLEAFKLDSSDLTVQKRLTNLERKMGLLPPETINIEKNITDVVEEAPFTVGPTKRLTGKKFLKQGGYFVQPVKKLPHQVSKKPLKTVAIINKDEDPLKCAFDEINVGEIRVASHEKQISEKEECSNSASKSTEYSEPVNVSELPVPKTTMQFVSAWDRLNSTEAQYSYLKRIPGGDLPRIFKESLESFIFSDIIETLATEFLKANESVYPYLLGLSHVRRIKALLLFATKEDNANIKLLFGHIEKLNEVSESELAALKSFYYC